FFFFLAGFLCFLKKEKYFLASVFAFFASLTRLIGLFLIIFFIFKFFEKKIKKINLFFVFSPIFGFLAYCFYLWKTTGDPLMFFHSQPAFGANRSTSLIFLPQVAWRYLKIFFTADFNFQYFIAIFEFFVFFLVLSVLLLDLKNLVSIKNLKLKIKNYDYLALNIFSFANLILPSLTGTFSSIPRYSLFSLSFFIYLRKIKNKFLKFLILLFFLIFHTILLVFFSQGYFVS
ncbi:MAG: hypothetical protein N2593_01795, partial [Patescibacteria group bacterium]|nr:hypothetical protein [Patescibacteria group bacterium]